MGRPNAYDDGSLPSSAIGAGPPPCPADPWVILADVSITDDCKVRGVNCFTHRRYVVSFADFYFVCAQSAPNTGFSLGNAAPLSNATASMRMMSMMSGTANLMDTSATMSGEAPRAMVALSRSDASTTMLPAHFSVERGTTVADLLEREGDREYYDAAADRLYTLRDNYRAAGVPLSTALSSTATALGPLEGAVFDAEAAATGDDADAMRVTTLAGVSETSQLGRRLAGLTVAEVGAMTREDFVAHATKGVAARQKKQLAEQAHDVWRLARDASVYAPERDADE
ncbi:MAG: hypothetical protein V4550_10180 [Gemmatimonadota bacterium]